MQQRRTEGAALQFSDGSLYPHETPQSNFKNLLCTANLVPPIPTCGWRIILSPRCLYHNQIPLKKTYKSQWPLLQRTPDESVFFFVFFLSLRLRCSAPFVKRGRVCHSFFLPESSRIMQVKSGISHKKHNSPALSSLWMHLHPHLEQAATTLLFFPFFSQLRQIILSLSQCQAAGLCCMNFLLEEKKKKKFHSNTAWPGYKQPSLVNNAAWHLVKL